MVTRTERRWALWFGLLVALVTMVPYVLAYDLQGQTWRYTGFLFGVEDGNSYAAKMLSGAAGHWLFRTPYTPYPQAGVLAFLPYLLLGKLSAPPGQHEQLIALFQLLRVAGTLLFGLATYDFLAVFIQSSSLRRLGTALAMLGGGLGWLAVIGLGGLWQPSALGQVLPGMDLPLEFYSPETFGFLMVLGLPHLAVARALLLWGLRDYLLPPQTAAGGLRCALHRLRPGLLWLVMGLFQPLTVISGWAVLAAHLAWVAVMDRSSRPVAPDRTGAGAASRWKHFFAEYSGEASQADQNSEMREAAQEADRLRVYFWRAVRIGLVSAPVVAYTFLAFRLDPFLRGWEQQNQIVSPPFHHYLLAFGLVLVLAGWGIRPLMKGQSGTSMLRTAGFLPISAGWLPLAWVVIFPLLAYAPYNLQRRLPDGIWVALLTLALVGIERWPAAKAHITTTLPGEDENASSQHARPPDGRRWALRALVGLGFLSTLLVSLGSLFGVLQPGLPAYRPADEVRGFVFLAARAETDALVLAAYATGNALPAWAPLRVLVGLGPESVNLQELNRRIACFYSEACSSSARRALLDEFGVRYVWYGPAERELGNWDPQNMAELELIYHEGAYHIYRYR